MPGSPLVLTITAILTTVSPALCGSVQCGTLVASNFLGGSGKDGLYETPIAVDADGNIFVAGRTKSTNFPVISGCHDTDGHNGGVTDIVVVKFSSDLTTLLASTYLGGYGSDGNWPGVALAIDQQGNVFVAGNTDSGNLPYNYGNTGDRIRNHFSHNARCLSGHLWGWQ